MTHCAPSSDADTPRCHCSVARNTSHHRRLPAASHTAAWWAASALDPGIVAGRLCCLWSRTCCVATRAFESERFCRLTRSCSQPFVFSAHVHVHSGRARLPAAICRRLALCLTRPVPSARSAAGMKMKGPHVQQRRMTLQVRQHSYLGMRRQLQAVATAATAMKTTNHSVMCWATPLRRRPTSVPLQDAQPAATGYFALQKPNRLAVVFADAALLLFQ